MTVTPPHITSLAPNEVFVFGSNTFGFHGAGAAGYACRGDAANTWRDDPWFKAAMDSGIGSSARVGKWAIYGVSAGFMKGREGASYAIPTILRPGRQYHRSLPLELIAEQVAELIELAKTRTDRFFLVTELGCVNAGWTPADIAPMFRDIPANVSLPQSFWDVLNA